VSLNIWSNTTGFSGFYYLVICSDFTTDVFMPDSGRWINALLAIADRSRRDSNVAFAQLTRKSSS
jgi:hypothetical protein